MNEIVHFWLFWPFLVIFGLFGLFWPFLRFLPVLVHSNTFGPFLSFFLLICDNFGVFLSLLAILAILATLAYLAFLMQFWVFFAILANFCLLWAFCPFLPPFDLFWVFSYTPFRHYPFDQNAKSFETKCFTLIIKIFCILIKGVMPAVYENYNLSLHSNLAFRNLQSSTLDIWICTILYIQGALVN